MGKYRGYISVNIDQSVDIDVAEVIDEISSEDMIAELRDRGDLPSPVVNEFNMSERLDYRILMEELIPIFGMLSPDQWREMINEYRERHQLHRLPEMRVLSA